MGQGSNSAIVAILRPPLLLLRFVVESLYRVFFAWWLDERFTRNANSRFADQIRSEVPFLFDNCNALLIANDHEPPPLFDFAAV
ncbi:MAG TPA: hypothetical protein VG897_05875, partial [Terriglobales bacterium]|nr:hypothetical protein [Terriglobales bacterium]